MLDGMRSGAHSLGIKLAFGLIIRSNGIKRKIKVCISRRIATFYSSKCGAARQTCKKY